MNKSAMKQLIESHKRESKKQARWEKKRKFCKSCGTERTMGNRESFRNGICNPCLVDWEEEREIRELEIKERLVLNSVTYRIEREDEKEGEYRDGNQAVP